MFAQTSGRTELVAKRAEEVQKIITIVADLLGDGEICFPCFLPCCF